MSRHRWAFGVVTFFALSVALTAGALAAEKPTIGIELVTKNGSWRPVSVVFAGGNFQLRTDKGIGVECILADAVRFKACAPEKGGKLVVVTKDGKTLTPLSIVYKEGQWSLTDAAGHLTTLAKDEVARAEVILDVTQGMKPLWQAPISEDVKKTLAVLEKALGPDFGRERFHTRNAATALGNMPSGNVGAVPRMAEIYDELLGRSLKDHTTADEWTRNRILGSIAAIATKHPEYDLSPILPVLARAEKQDPLGEARDAARATRERIETTLWTRRKGDDLRGEGLAAWKLAHKALVAEVAKEDRSVVSAEPTTAYMRMTPRGDYEFIFWVSARPLTEQQPPGISPRRVFVTVIRDDVPAMLVPPSENEVVNTYSLRVKTYTYVGKDQPSDSKVWR